MSYDIEALRQTMEKCDANIKIFEDAIKKEEETKRQYRALIRELEYKRDNPVPKEIKIVVNRE